MFQNIHTYIHREIDRCKQTNYIYIYIYICMTGHHIHTYNSSLLTQNAFGKTYRQRWMIGTDGVRESGKSVLAVRLGDDNIYIYIYIVIHRQTVSFYQNSSVWLDPQDARSRDRNPSNFTIDVLIIGEH